MLSTAKLAAQDDPYSHFEPYVPPPVETQAGEEMRQKAIEVLGRRVAELTERYKKQRLTGLESRELEESQAAIHTLKAMAPVGALVPSRVDPGWSTA